MWFISVHGIPLRSLLSPWKQSLGFAVSTQVCMQRKSTFTRVRKSAIVANDGHDVDDGTRYGHAKASDPGSYVISFFVLFLKTLSTVPSSFTRHTFLPWNSACSHPAHFALRLPTRKRQSVQTNPNGETTTAIGSAWS